MVNWMVSNFNLFFIWPSLKPEYHSDVSQINENSIKINEISISMLYVWTVWLENKSKSKSNASYL